MGPDGKPIARKPTSSLSRRTAVEVGATIRVWWPDDQCFYEARVKAVDRATDTHTLLYIEDGVEETIDLKNERVELRYKPHKRGAKESWMPIRYPSKKAKAPKAPKRPREPKKPKEPKPKKPKKIKPPKPPKLRAPPPAKVRVVAVAKDQIVRAGAHVRVWWPLDEAWYGGEVLSYDEETKTHAVKYYDGVEERLNFNKEKVTTVERVDGDGDGNGSGAGVTSSLSSLSFQSIHGMPPVRIPVVGGETRAWFLPSPRRGEEKISFLEKDASTGEETTVVMSAVDFNNTKCPDTEGPKRWRRTIRFDASRASERLRHRGGHKEISIGRWLLQQGGAWGEAIVGRPIRLRPWGWTYTEDALVEGERVADEAYEREKREREEAAAAAAAAAAATDAAPAEATDAAAAAAAEESAPMAEGGGGVDEDVAMTDAARVEENENEKEETERKTDADAPATGAEDADEAAADAADDADDDDAKESAKEEWWDASIVKYNATTGDHQVMYEDGVREWLSLVCQESDSLKA